MAWSLTPDNRQRALEATGKTAEAADLLRSEDLYNAEGTELTSTLGPQHTIELANHTQVTARKHIQYYYDHGSPGGAVYGLVTTTEEAAKLTIGEEKEVRTVWTGYEGQEHLGWKLHAPTSTGTYVNSAGGERRLESSTQYDPVTGNVTETTSPGGDTPTVVPQYATQFGKGGTEGGQLNGATGMGLDATGNVWIADDVNNRVEEFSPTGTFMQMLGYGVLNGKAEMQDCTAGCKPGIAGAGAGQLSGPQAVTISGNEIYVSDGSNNRINVYSSSGVFVRSFGSSGSGAGSSTTCMV